MLSCDSCGDQLTVAAGKRPVCFCDHILCETCVDETGVCPLCNLRTDLTGDERVCVPLLKGVKKSVGSASKAVRYPCDNHGESEFKFVCYEHKAVLCADCAWDHRNHESIKKYGTNDVQADLLLVCEVLDNHMNQCQELRKSATDVFAEGEMFAYLERYHNLVKAIAEDRTLTFAPLVEPVLRDIGSTILDRVEVKVVSNFLIDFRIGKITQLLYRASIDGDSAEQFHARCDDQGPVLVVVSAKGKKFGGFAFGGFSRNGFHDLDYRNFLFHLKPDFTFFEGPNLITLRSPGLGPVFGEEFVLCISPECLSKINSWCRPRKSYGMLDEKKLKCIKNLALFQVTDYEVFSVRW